MTDLASIVFIPHGGGPLPLLDEVGNADLNRFLRGIPATITKPDAIVVFSAHWEETVVSITASAAPPLLFDYHGFPEETYQYARKCLEAGVDMLTPGCAMAPYTPIENINAMARAAREWKN